MAKEEKPVGKISNLKKYKKKKYTFDDIKKNLKKNNACYVLITCSEPSVEGKMQVELNYFGDKSLAMYLIDGAQCVFDSQINNVIEN